VQVVVVDRHLVGVLDPDLVLIDRSDALYLRLPLKQRDDAARRHCVHVDEMAPAVPRRHVIEIHVIHGPNMAAVRGRVHVAKWDDGRHFIGIGRWAGKLRAAASGGQSLLRRGGWVPCRLRFSGTGCEDASGKKGAARRVPINTDHVRSPSREGEDRQR
jgi:hypothetical protein